MLPMFGRHSTMSTMYDLLSNVTGDTILKFLKLINVYAKI